MTTNRAQTEKGPGAPAEQGAPVHETPNEGSITPLHSVWDSDGYRPAPKLAGAADDYPWQLIAEVNLANAPGDEHLAAESAAAIAGVVGPLRLPPQRQARLLAAVEQAALNAAGHSDGPQPGRPVSLRILAPRGPAVVDPPRPARGWGYFLIEKISDPDLGDPHPVIEIFLYQEGGG
jgi:hypothetical protein